MYNIFRINQQKYYDDQEKITLQNMKILKYKYLRINNSTKHVIINL